MRRLIIITILATICGMTAMAQDRPDITRQTTGGNHGGVGSYNLAMPVLTYDAVSHEIIVNGNAEQYNVEVTIASNHALVLSMVVEGDMGVIDAAILTNDVYNIALTDDGNRQYNYRFNGSSKSLTFEGTSYYKPSNSTSVIVDQNMR